VTREQLSVRERMSSLLRRLQSGGFVNFEDLFEPDRGVAELVVTFLAILELGRESLGGDHPAGLLLAHLRKAEGWKHRWMTSRSSSAL